MPSAGDASGQLPPPPPPPGPPGLPPPPPAPPRRAWWPWAFGGVLALIVAVVAVRGLGGSSDESGSDGGSPAGESSGDDGCPTGRPTARVATFTPEVMVGPMPGDPSGPTVYEVTVEFAVTNEASAPIRVETIEARTIHQPEAAIVAYGDNDEIAPGDTVTVEGYGNVTIEGAGAAVPPAPDPSSVELTASWADDDLFRCGPPT